MRSLATLRSVTIFAVAIAVTVHLCCCDAAQIVGYQNANNDTGFVAHEAWVIYEDFAVNGDTNETSGGGGGTVTGSGGLVDGLSTPTDGETSEHATTETTTEETTEVTPSTPRLEATTPVKTNAAKKTSAHVESTTVAHTTTVKTTTEATTKPPAPTTEEPVVTTRRPKTTTTTKRTTTSEAEHFTSKETPPETSPTLTSTTVKGTHKKKKRLNLFLIGIAKQDKLKKLMRLISRKQGGRAKSVPVKLAAKRPKRPSRARRPIRLACCQFDHQVIEMSIEKMIAYDALLTTDCPHTALSPAVPVASEVEQRRALLREQRANDESERHHKTRWRSKLHSVASTVTFVVGHGNVIHFPYLCAKHGGAAFLIPYTVANICVGVPLMYAEMSMAQFASVSPHKLFTRIGPAFIGVAASMAAVLVYRSFYFSAIMAQSFYVGVLALIGIASKMPWSTCDWTENDCGTCDRFKETFECESLANLRGRANESFGLRRYQIESPYQSSYLMSTVQEVGYTVEDFKAPDPYIVLALLGIWLAAAALCHFGIRRMSTVFHVLKAIGVIVAVAVFGVAAYDGSKSNYFNGAKLFFTAADLKSLVHMQPCLGDGSILKLASHNQFNNNVLYDVMFATVADFVISVIGGVSFFASMGAVTERLYSQTGSLVESTKLTSTVAGQMLHSKMELLLLHGQTLVLSSFPDQMSSKTWGAVPTAAHYFNVVKLGLPSLVIFLSVTLRIVSDGSTRLFRWSFWRNWKCRRAICLAVLTVLSVGCSVVLVSPSGVLLARLLDKYTGIALLFIAFSEIVAIIHCYGFKRYISNIYTMLGMPLAAWQVHTFAGLYYFVTPAFLIIALILQFVFHKPTVVQLYIFPGYFDGFGWFIAATCMILIPIGWLRKLIPTVVCKLPTTDLYEPTGNWGPVARKNREVSRYNERAFRAKH